MKSESMSTNLRVCVVGTGPMGIDHIERLTRRIVGAEVAVVVDVDLSRAKKATEVVPSAVAMSNIARALDQGDIHKVIIATPGFFTKRRCFKLGNPNTPNPSEPHFSQILTCSEPLCAVVHLYDPDNPARRDEMGVKPNMQKFLAVLSERLVRASYSM